MNILGIMCVSLAVNTWGLHMFDLHMYPDWARPLNVSLATVATHTVSAMNMTGQRTTTEMDMDTLTKNKNTSS